MNIKRSLFFIFFCLANVPLILAQEREISGTITDEEGVPLPDVTVTIKDTDDGVNTDFDGEYSIEATEGAVLIYSYIGYQTIEQEVEDSNTINITLKQDSQDLDEAVVVAFGKQKKKNLTGSVSTISDEVIKDRPLNNAVDALQGTVTGLSFNVGSGGGELGSSKNFNIRGAGTVGSTNSSPLILIDGMEGDLSSINPRDIKDITVLKDAAASSIYGSRAPFGVVMVTTKEGSAGKLTASYDAIVRWDEPLLTPNMLNSVEFANYYNAAASNAGNDPLFSAKTLEKMEQFRNGEIDYGTEWNEDSKSWRGFGDGFADTDWFNEFYRSWVPSTEHNFSVQGGAEKVNYYFSANWLGQEGFMRYNQDKQDRYQINGKINMQILPSLKLSYNTRFKRTHYRGSAFMGNSGGLFYHNIARRWPNLPVSDPNGNPFEESQISQLENSLTKRERDELNQQISLVFEPIEGWETIADFNYRTVNGFTHNEYLPVYKYDKDGEAVEMEYGAVGTLYNAPGKSEVNESGDKMNFLNTNVYSTYETDFGDHNVKAMVGMQAELNKTRALGAARDMVYSTSVPTINSTYGDSPGVSGDFQHWATFGTFGRLNYNYKEKYLLEMNMRYDGTSRFLKDQRWNWFPSISAGWNVAAEEFWSGLGAVGDEVNEFKLRASYGTLGNQNTSNWYPFFQQMPLGTDDGLWLINNSRTNTASAPGLISSFLSWEKIQTWNFGLDLSAFDNRLTFIIDYFRRNTKDMVGPGIEMPAVLGTSVPEINNADMLSEGFEIEVGWRGNIGGDFTYSVNGSVSDNRQKITKYNNDNKDLSQYYKGMYLGEIWGYETEGIARSQDEMDKWLQDHNQSKLGSNWSAGDIMYRDLDGDGEIDDGSQTLDDPGDRRIIGNESPRYNFGLRLDMSYKNFDLGLFFQGTGKRDVNASGEPYYNGANGNQWQASGFKEHLDYFRSENTDSPFGPNVDSFYPRPLFDEGGKNFHPQTRWIENGAYIRLKNVQLGYNFPEDIIESIGFSKLRVFVSAENIFTYTKLSKIFDPETINGSYGQGKLYPLSKTISTGISLTF